MSIEYMVVDYVSRVRNYAKYEIADTEENLKAWRKLQNDFVAEFSAFNSEKHKDYDFAEWHDGFKILYVYIYNEMFYNNSFIPKILNILNKNGDCFAEFECFNNSQKCIGRFQVYKDMIRCNDNAERTGLMKRLCGNGKDIDIKSLSKE